MATPRKPRSKPVKAPAVSPTSYVPAEAADPRWHVIGPMPGTMTEPAPATEPTPAEPEKQPAERPFQFAYRTY